MTRRPGVRPGLRTPDTGYPIGGSPVLPVVDVRGAATGYRSPVYPDRRRLTWPAWAVDGGVALVVGVLQVYTSTAASRIQPDARRLDALAYATLVGTALVLVWRRHRPVPVLAVTVAGSLLYFARQYPYALSPLAALVAVTEVISRGSRLVGWVGAGCLIAVPGVAAVLFSPDDIAAALAWAMAVLALGQLAEVTRARRAYTEEMERRLLEAERTREEEALRRAHEERLRIARDLHDVTSHTVSVIALQAAVAAEAIDRPDGRAQVRAALGAIRTASRQAMAEMSAALGVLRPDAGAGPRRPTPGTGQLPELAEALTGSGIRVEFVEVGQARPLPPALDLTVYRVVQEALTNTLRHAAASRVVVTLRYEAGAVLVQVTDDGRGPGPEADRGVGHGLIGMAERVAAVGGRLSVGPAAEGGFQVVARLPMQAESVT